MTKATATPTSIVVNGATDPKQKKVCRNEVATGSVMPKRVCRTIAEGQTANAQADRELERIRERQLGEQQALMNR